MAKDAPLAVDVPATDRDKPAWVKVGIIAAVGFVVGIAWPRLVGVRIAPAAPGESAAASSGSSAHAGRAPDPPPASVVSKSSPPAGSASVAVATPPSSAAAATTPGTPPTITLQKGTVLSCKTAEGETKKGSKECGPIPGIDMLVMPRIRKIATCGGVEGQTGKLSLVVNADFASGRFWYDVGKTSTVQNVDAVSSCLKTTFHGTSTTATAHEHPRYTVLYTANLSSASPNGAGAGAKEEADDKHKAKEAAADAKDPKETKEDSSPPPSSPSASGEAQVAWEVALVRDAPKTGGLVSRLPRGTKVKVGAARDGWYQIKFGDNFSSEGWVYRGAIGR
jgi:hypothetical protein